MACTDMVRPSYGHVEGVYRHPLSSAYDKANTPVSYLHRICILSRLRAPINSSLFITMPPYILLLGSESGRILHKQNRHCKHDVSL